MAADIQPEYRGLILQRGGEELLLTKLPDRFTVRLVNDESDPAILQTALQPQTVRRLPTGNLFEVTVAADQLETAMAQARQLDDVRFASHVYSLESSPATAVYLGDQITVQFADATPTETIETLLADLGLNIVQPIAGLAGTYVVRVGKTATENPIKLANRLAVSPHVLVAEPDVIIQTQTLYRPTDPLYAEQWYLQHDGGAELAANSHIEVEAAWELTRGNRSVVVAIIDDGFDLNHPDFQGLGKIVAPYDFYAQDFLPLPEQPAENHGTAVAGVAIAEENGQGIVGVAPGCALMPIRSTGYIDDDSIERMFGWAMTHGADVISCSWGVSAVYFPLSLRQRLAIHRAATEGRNGKGCVILFAAGNANRPVSGAINETGWSKSVIKGETQWLNGFAVHPDVMAVSAITSLNRKAAYSNWGKQISVAAPSNNAPPGTYLTTEGAVLTGPPVTIPLLGRGILTTDRLAELGYAAGDFTDTFGGTSSACPVVAGVAALVLSANPELTAAQVKTLIEQTAEKIVDPNPDPQLNLRKGTYSNQGHSEWFGYGRVQAQRAVQEALRRLPDLGQAVSQIQRRDDAIALIPDADPAGLKRAIIITEPQEIRSIQITLAVEHSFLGDLEIYLLPPQHPAILLQGRTLGRQTRLQTTYSLATTPNLSPLLGKPANGRWQLWLIDRVPENTGQLQFWQIDLGLA